MEPFVFQAKFFSWHLPYLLVQALVHRPHVLEYLTVLTRAEGWRPRRTHHHGVLVLLEGGHGPHVAHTFNGLVQ